MLRNGLNRAAILHPYRGSKTLVPVQDGLKRVLREGSFQMSADAPFDDDVERRRARIEPVQPPVSLLRRRTSGRHHDAVGNVNLDFWLAGEMVWHGLAHPCSRCDTRFG